jgi:acyl-coenzyme A synthetase/AMP-(fatty) acid ligase
VPVNVLYRARKIAHILGDAEPALFVRDATTDLQMTPAPPAVSLQDLEREADPAAEALTGPALDGDTPGALVYTSGTAADPLAVRGNRRSGNVGLKRSPPPPCCRRCAWPTRPRRSSASRGASSSWCAA